ncbi:MAG: helix-turn-helix domain-containing protein [Bacteroidetes bacterium]|nr:MAG: helix-turn-helix domain-containing protein [Bacteroidota bacterium]
MLMPFEFYSDVTCEPSQNFVVNKSFFIKRKPKNKNVSEWIDYFFELKQENDTPHISIIFPAGCSKFIVHKKTVPEISNLHNITWKKLPKQYVYISQKTAHLTKLPKKLHVFGVKFFPWSAFPFIDTSLINPKLSRQPATILFPEEFLKKINTLPFDDWQQKIETFITEKLSEISLPHNYFIIKQFCQNLLKNPDTEMDIPFGKRQFQRLFKQYTFHTLSEFKKLHRFQNVLEKAESVKLLTELAYECQYADQSHFVKDFKSITGLTPKKYFSDPLLCKVSSEYFAMKMKSND